jgi:hypothetical protein
MITFRSITQSARQHLRLHSATASNADLSGR